MNKEHQKRIHKLEEEESRHRNDFFIETSIKFIIDTINVYKDLITKIKDGETSPEEAIKYLDEIVESLTIRNL